MKQRAARGSTAKHAGTHKSAGTSKHAPSKQPAGAKAHKPKTTVKATHATHAKARGLGDVAWCSAEALRASLRLAGGSATDVDVWALHVAAGGSRDRGVPILAVLRAASVHGLGGVRLLWFGTLEPGWDLVGGGNERRVPLNGFTNDPGHVQPQVVENPFLFVGACEPHEASVILGLELPGAHAVAVGSDGCWLSWGGHYDPAEFPGAVAEEAWAVTWQ